MDSAGTINILTLFLYIFDVVIAYARLLVFTCYVVKLKFTLLCGHYLLLVGRNIVHAIYHYIQPIPAN